MPKPASTSSSRLAKSRTMCAGSRVAAAIHAQGVQVHNARIATFGEKVEDTFLLSNADHQPLDDKARAALEENIENYLE